MSRNPPCCLLICLAVFHFAAYTPENGFPRQNPGPRRPPATVPSECLVAIEAMPELRNGEYSWLMDLSDGIRTIEISCDPEWDRWFGFAQSEKPLVFVLWERREYPGGLHGGPGEAMITWQVAGIWDKEEKLFDSSVCPLHQRQMARGLVPISHGLPSDEFRAAEPAFSGGPGFLQGGCVNDGRGRDFGYTCPECAGLYRNWAETMNGPAAGRPQD